MQRTMMKSKLHSASVTEANLQYEGSITIDQQLMERADLLEGEKVSVVNINNGLRFETYVIVGPKDSGVICLNGPAARLAQVGDTVHIISYAQYSEQELENYRANVVLLSEHNQVKEPLSVLTLKKEG